MIAYLIISSIRSQVSLSCLGSSYPLPDMTATESGWAVCRNMIHFLSGKLTITDIIAIFAIHMVSAKPNILVIVPNRSPKQETGGDNGTHPEVSGC